MIDSKRISALIMMMMISSLIISGITMSVLYRAAIAEQKTRLVISSQMRARLIEAVARFDAVQSVDYPGGAYAATLRQITDAYHSLNHFGRTGEITLAKREGNQMVWLLNYRHGGIAKRQPIPFDSSLAEPMRRALLGKSGVMVGTDYAGVTVLAAYEPVAILKLGLVTKIDLSEVREPFIKAGLIALAFTLLIVLASSKLIVRITQPLLTQILRERDAKLSAARDEIVKRQRVENILRESQILLNNIIDCTPSHIFALDLQHRFTLVNKALAEFYRLPKEALLGRPLEVAIPRDVAERLIALNNQVMTSGKTLSIEEEIASQHQSKPVTMIATKFPLRDVCGKVYGLGGVATDITERKEMEQALRKREEQLKWVLEGGYLGFWDWDIVTGKVERNAIWANMLGYTFEEIQQTTQQWTDFIYPDDREMAWQSIEAALAGQKPYHEAEYRMLHKNGSLKWILDHASVVQWDADGKPTRMSGTHTDITDLKTMEAALRLSESRFKNLFIHAPLGIALIDSLSGQIYQANQKYAAILGITVEALQSIKWMQITHPDDIQADLENMALMNSGQTKGFSMEKRYIRADGKIIWVNITVARMPVDADGRRCHHCIVEDITHRKQAEIDLRIAATVFEAQEGMMITNAQGIILRVNHAFTEITGYTADEVVGKNPNLLSSGKHKSSFYRQLWQTIQHQGAWRGELWNRRKNGQIYPQALTITAVKTDCNQHVTHYVATLSDISDRKATEEYINQLAFYDPLTQLPNRRLLQERLKHGLNVSRRNGSQMAVLMMDLDKFKAVNDTFGHTAGDELLQQVAKRIKACLREVDLVARLGGDEFVVVIENIRQHEHVARIAEAIIASVSQPFTLCHDHTAHIGTSVGIAIHPPHGETIEALMDNADAALYQAKDNGRGCFAYFSDVLTNANGLLASEPNFH